jgi:hypothetical protein
MPITVHYTVFIEILEVHKGSEIICCSRQRDDTVSLNCD